MVSKGQGKERELARRGARREKRKRILNVCEGAVTEGEYFKDFQNRERNLLMHVTVVGAGAVPLAVVEKAVEIRKQAEQRAREMDDTNELFEIVWAVFDVDAHPNLPEARSLATRESVCCAVSDPCFELWAILHFQDQTGHIERGKLQSKLKKHLPNYNAKNNKRLDYDKMAPSYDDAVRRAKQLAVNAKHKQDPGGNPTTNVHELTELIRKNH